MASTAIALGEAIGLPFLRAKESFVDFAVLLAAVGAFRTSYVALVHLPETIEYFLEMFVPAWH